MAAGDSSPLRYIFLRDFDHHEGAPRTAVTFWVETFAPTENFKPEKAYVTRLKLRDGDGNDQSKLLLTEPETVIAVVIRGGTDGAPLRADVQRRSARRTALVRS
jgi:hypothetical protein